MIRLHARRIVAFLLTFVFAFSPLSALADEELVVSESDVPVEAVEEPLTEDLAVEEPTPEEIVTSDADAKDDALPPTVEDEIASTANEQTTDVAATDSETSLEVVSSEPAASEAQTTEEEPGLTVETQKSEQETSPPAKKDKDSAISVESVETPVLSGSTKMQTYGWVDGSLSGESLRLGKGKSKRMEALKLSVSTGSIFYSVYCQKSGWRDWVKDGKAAKATGKPKQIEAVRIRLGDELASEWSVQYRAKIKGFGWSGWAADGDVAGTTGASKKVVSLQVRIVPSGTPLPASDAYAYPTFLVGKGNSQKTGWQKQSIGNVLTIGTTGKSLRLEACKLSLAGGEDGGIRYRVRGQGYGWQGWKKNGALAGTTGKSKRIEAVRISLTGKAKANYDVWYRVYVQKLGWLGWTANGKTAGTKGMSMRAEAIQVALVAKGGERPQEGDELTPLISKPKVTFSEGAPGSGKAMKSFYASLNDTSRLSITYRVHQIKGDWTDAASNGVSVGKGKIDAIRVKLRGYKAKTMNVWYRAYVKGSGWTQWAKNGKDAGSLGKNTPIDAVQVRVVSKYAKAPSNKDAHFNVACVSGSTGQLLSQANARQKKIVKAANNTPWPGVGLCAGWVENVYKNAGICDVSGNACDLYDLYCKSSDLSNLKVGMIVAVHSHTHTQAGSIWGHVGIYVGDGWIMHSVTSGVRKMSVNDWIDYYGTTYTPKWGWLGNSKVA